MSFWSDLGDAAESGIDWAYNHAQVGALNDLGNKVTGLNSDKLASGTFVNHATGQSFQTQGPADQGLIGKGLTALAWTPTMAGRGLAAASIHGQGGVSWDTAWGATSAEGVTINGTHVANVSAGQLGANILLHDPLGLNQDATNLTKDDNAKQFNSQIQNTWTGKISSGLLDTALTWYADPTIVGGKVAKLSRAANEVKSGAEADQIVAHAQAIRTGDVALEAGPSRLASLPNSDTGLFSKSLTESGQRLFKLSEALVGPQRAEVRAQILSRTPDSAPFMGFMDQIDKIDDADLKLEATMNVMGTIQGGEAARQALIQSQPQIARAIQRASMAPEGRDAMDLLSDAYSRLDTLNEANLKNLGDSWEAAAQSFHTPANLAEVLQGYGKQLDTLHAHLEGLTATVEKGQAVEFAGLSALDRLKINARHNIAQDFYFQDGPSGATVRVMHWGNSQRFDHTVSVDDTFRGNQELLDSLARDSLGQGKNKMQPFTADERLAYSDRFTSAQTKEERRRLVDEVEDAKVRKLADHYSALGYPVDENVVRSVIAKKNVTKGAGVRYSEEQINQAIANNRDHVLLIDPTTSIRTSIKKAVYETHVANNASMHSMDELDAMLRQEMGMSTWRDSLSAASQFVQRGLNAFSNAWRLQVLARPGLLVRTQIDSQGRALAVMRGTTVAGNALRGLGHTLGKKLSPEETLVYKATVGDRLKAADFREEAQRLHAAAERRASVTQQRLGTTEDDLDAPTIDDLGAALRDEDVDLDLPINAEAIQNQSAAALHARARRYEAAAQHLEDTTYEMKSHQLGAKPVMVRTKGGKSVEYQPFPKGDSQKEDILHELIPGGGVSRMLTMNRAQTAEDVLMDAVTHKQKRIYMDAHNYTSYDPKDQFWAPGWVKTTDVMRNSAVGKIILDADRLSTTDLTKLLMKDKEVDRAWKEVRSDNPSKRAWVNRTASIAVNMAPTPEIRAMLKARRPTVQDAEQMFANPRKSGETTLPARMPIEGPAFSFDRHEFDAPGARHNVVGDAASDFISFLSDGPDMKWARHPMFLDRQRVHMQKMVQQYEKENPDWTALPDKVMDHFQKTATHRAIQDVRQTMYNTGKRTGAMESARFASPFLGAWQDAIESWGRLFYDDPRRAGAFNKVWNIPNRMGLVVDENGSPIAPGGHANQSFVVLPRNFDNNYETSKKFVIRKDSLNSIFQGAQWYTPGLGPAVQIPLQEIIAKTYPELGDSNNPIVRTILPFGTPKTAGGGRTLSNYEFDLTNSFIPGWARALISTTDVNDPNNARAFLMSVNQQIIDARLAHKDVPNAQTLTSNAEKAARNAGFLRAAMSGLLGVTGEAENTADFYKKQYDLFMQQGTVNGKSATERFVEKFPEAAGLRWGLSQSETGIQATVAAYNAAQKLAPEIKANPQWGWAYVGAQNVGGQFSQSVYNAQASKSIDGTGNTERTLRSRADIVNGSLAEDGWAQYTAIQTSIDDELKARGKHDVNQKGAEDLKTIRTTFIADLKKQNAAWAEDFDSTDQGAIQRFISGFGETAINDPKLKNRSDIVLMKQYLDARTQAMEVLQGRGINSLQKAKKAADMRQVLFTLGSSLAQENFGFQQMWDRVLSHEVPTDKDQDQ